jgi:uncharacterized protein YndB with AHSA1/START domain
VVTFETDIRINASVAVVFAYLTDNQKMPLWNSAVLEVTKTTGGPVGVGTRFLMQRDLPTGRVENTLEVIEYEENRRVTLKTTSGPTPFVYRYLLEPTDGGTHLSLHADVQIGGALSVLSPVLAPRIRSGVDANFAALKDLVEGKQRVEA